MIKKAAKKTTKKATKKTTKKNILGVSNIYTITDLEAREPHKPSETLLNNLQDILNRLQNNYDIITNYDLDTLLDMADHFYLIYSYDLPHLIQAKEYKPMIYQCKNYGIYKKYKMYNFDFLRTYGKREYIHIN